MGAPAIPSIDGSSCELGFHYGMVSLFVLWGTGMSVHIIVATTYAPWLTMGSSQNCIYTASQTYTKSAIHLRRLHPGEHPGSRQPALGDGGLFGSIPLHTKKLHSSKLTWKWRGAPYKTTILYIGPSMSFHVNLGEGSSACHFAEARSAWSSCLRKKLRELWDKA